MMIAHLQYANDIMLIEMPSVDKLRSLMTN